MTINVYFSHSFDEQHASTVDVVRALMGDVFGFDLIETDYKSLDVRTIGEQVKNDVSRAAAFVGIVNKDTTWPLFEAGLAIKTIGFSTTICLVEEGFAGIRQLEQAVDHCYTFAPENQAALVRLLQKICSDIRRILLDPGQNPRAAKDSNRIKMAYASKKVWVYPDGLGVVCYKRALRVIEENGNLSRIEGSIRFNDNVPAGKKIPNIKTLANRSSYLETYKRMTFTYRLLSAPHPDTDITLVDKNPKPARERHFVFLVRPALAKGQELAIVWGWSCPNLYEPSKDTTVYEALYDIDNFDMEVSFFIDPSTVRSLDFVRTPTLMVLDKNGNERGSRRTPIEERGWRTDRYKWQGIPLNATDSVKVSWEMNSLATPASIGSKNPPRRSGRA